jgi:hypothetical protein
MLWRGNFSFRLPLDERRMLELVRALDLNMGFLRWELRETRRRLNEP